jgi:hypothetical protein
MIKSTMSEARISVTEVVTIDESRAVGNPPVMVERQVVSVPIGSPVVPAPAIAGEDTNSNPQAERNPWPIQVEARLPVPVRIQREGRPVYDPRIVFRHVNDFRVRRFNPDRLSIVRDVFLLRAIQVPSLLRSLTHDLNCIEDILFPVHVRIPERRGPGEVLVHHRKHRRELREGLYAGIPGLRIDRLGERICLQAGISLDPPVCFRDLRRIGRGRQDLRNQRVRVQCDRCYQLVQIFG